MVTAARQETYRPGPGASEGQGGGARSSTSQPEGDRIEGRDEGPSATLLLHLSG